MIVAIGPCMLLAPFVFILALLAIPFWPVILALVGLAWLVVWPLERMALAMGMGDRMVWAPKIGRAFRVLLTPWSYFDLPAKKPPAAREPEPEEKPPTV
jgi:hypothetical protein